MRLPALAPMLALLAVAAAACGDSGRPRVQIAAAADLRDAFEALAPAFERACECEVGLVFGSSGTFATQIGEGLPVDAFFSANETYVDDLAERGLVLADTVRLYAVGRIVLATPAASGRTVASLDDLLDPAITKVAIPNPEHAPYGMAAREALETEGLWDAVRGKLVFGENAAQATDFVESGNAAAGILPLSLAVQRQDRLQYTLIDDRLHEPLRQAAGVVARGEHPDLARAFIEFVDSPEGRSIMRSYGFILPGEERSP